MEPLVEANHGNYKESRLVRPCGPPPDGDRDGAGPCPDFADRRQEWLRILVGHSYGGG